MLKEQNLEYDGSKLVRPNVGDFAALGNIFQRPETFVAVIVGDGVLLALTGRGQGCTGLHPHSK